MKYKKVVLEAYYELNDGYISFPENPIDGKEFHNVNVEFTTRPWSVGGVKFEWDVIKIDGEEPIECEIIGQIHRTDGTMIIQICQDWG